MITVNYFVTGKVGRQGQKGINTYRLPGKLIVIDFCDAIRVDGIRYFLV